MVYFLSTISLALASMTYPIHLGGFGSGDTILEKFAFDSSMNLVVTGVSHDTELVDVTPSHFIMYLPSTSSTWSWKKQITSFPEDSLVDMIFSTDDMYIALLY